MSELAAPLRRAMESTGYLTGTEPAAATVRLAGNGGAGGGLARTPSFAPEAWWRSNPDATARHSGADLNQSRWGVDRPMPDRYVVMRGGTNMSVPSIANRLRPVVERSSLPTGLRRNRCHRTKGRQFHGKRRPALR